MDITKIYPNQKNKRKYVEWEKKTNTTVPTYCDDEREKKNFR